MNNPRQGARLTVYSREQIVARLAVGQKAVAVAAAFGVSLHTVRKWLARFTHHCEIVETGNGHGASKTAPDPDQGLTRRRRMNAPSAQALTSTTHRGAQSDAEKGAGLRADLQLGRTRRDEISARSPTRCAATQAARASGT